MKENNKWKYQGDGRYERVYERMQFLGIQDVTTNRQHKNGTIVWRLPIKNKWKNGKLIEVASFKTGYVRNQGKSTRSNYQLNKRIFKNDLKTCKLIPIEIDRLEYLISYCLKNYYIGKANQVANGEFVPKWVYQDVYEQAKNAKAPEVSVNINGQRYEII